MTDQIDISLLFETLHVPMGHQTVNRKILHRSPSSAGETKRTDNTSIDDNDNDNESLQSNNIDNDDAHYQDSRFQVPLEVVPSEDQSCTSSLSSVASSDEEDSAAPRTLFSTHWQKTSASQQQQQQQQKRRTRPFPKTVATPTKETTTATATTKVTKCPFDTDSDDSDCSSKREQEGKSQSGNSYERTLRKREGIKQGDNNNCSNGPVRRTLFGGCMEAQRSSQPRRNSISCFAPTPMALLSRRNANSDSALVMTKLPSCLRPPKYSGTEPSRHLNRQQPVSFATSVTTMNYEIPQEQWAASGWSSYFY